MNPPREGEVKLWRIDPAEGGVGWAWTLGTVTGIRPTFQEALEGVSRG